MQKKAQMRLLWGQKKPYSQTLKTPWAGFMHHCPIGIYGTETPVHLTQLMTLNFPFLFPTKTLVYAYMSVCLVKSHFGWTADNWSSLGLRMNCSTSRLSLISSRTSPSPWTTLLQWYSMSEVFFQPYTTPSDSTDELTCLQWNWLSWKQMGQNLTIIQIIGMLVNQLKWINQVETNDQNNTLAGKHRASFCTSF